MQLIDEDIWEYICEHSSKEEKLLSELRRETEIKCLNPIMLSSVFQGNLLSIISKIKNPRKILEIGTYSGYSTLCLADGLTMMGKYILSIKMRTPTSKISILINQYTEKNNSTYRNALNIIPNLNLKFDIVFIDADKENYSEYLKMILPNMNKGAV